MKHTFNYDSVSVRSRAGAPDVLFLPSLFVRKAGKVVKRADRKRQAVVVPARRTYEEQQSFGYVVNDNLQLSLLPAELDEFRFATEELNRGGKLAVEVEVTTEGDVTSVALNGCPLQRRIFRKAHSGIEGLTERGKAVGK